MALRPVCRVQFSPACFGGRADPLIAIVMAEAREHAFRRVYALVAIFAHETGCRLEMARESIKGRFRPLRNSQL